MVLGNWPGTRTGAPMRVSWAALMGLMAKRETVLEPALTAKRNC